MPLSKSQKVQAEDPRVQAKTDKEPEMLTETATKRERRREREGQPSQGVLLALS